MLTPLLALALAHVRGDVGALELYRGAPLPNTVAATYQDVEDTTLDSEEATLGHGGDYTLSGGPGKNILIRFGSLRAIAGSVTVVSAKLVLTTSSDEHPTLHSVLRVLKPWGEGPARTLADDSLPPDAKPPQILGMATWKAGLSGIPGGGWQLPGATGAEDGETLAGAKGEMNGNQFMVSGLADAVQTMIDDPAGNYGFLLSFENAVDFASSESPGGKPRLLLTLAPANPFPGPDLSVDSVVVENGGLTATVTNRGNAPVSGLGAVWAVDGIEGATTKIADVIPPGGSKTLRHESLPRQNPLDNRVGSVALRITSDPTDHNLADKQMTVYPSGLPVTLVVDPGLIKSTATLVSERGVGLTDWANSAVDAFNRVYLARSRYSFAPDGCLARIRLAKIATDQAASTGVSVTITADELNEPWPFPLLMKQLALACGAPNLGMLEIPVGAAGAPPYDVAGISLHRDVTGGGDTRFDGSLPKQIILNQVPVQDPTIELPPDACGLLSPVAVGLLNRMTNEHDATRRKDPRLAATAFQSVVFLSVTDGAGAALRGAQLAFFQVHHGVVDAKPAFTLGAGDSGTVLLPSRSVPNESIKNPFASSDIVGDGAFLIRADARGETAWAWLKAWQLQDAYMRGDLTFASIPIRFQLPSAPIDRTIDRALGRVVTDSADDLPGKLGPLVDGSGTKTVQLPEKEGSWIEVDLNRDWSIGELQISVRDESLWKRFKIMVYQTGQTPSQAFQWASEVNAEASTLIRGRVGPNGLRTVVYNGPVMQVRHIRIVSLADGPGALSQIAVYSVKPR